MLVAPICIQVDIYKWNFLICSNLGLEISTHINTLDIVEILRNADETLPFNLIPIFMIDFLRTISLFICLEHINARYWHPLLPI